MLSLKGKIKTKAKRFLHYFGWKLVSLTVIVLTSVVTLWAYAAFTEPAVAPASSDQDFAQNISGNNDANNDFDSSSVASNRDGSIIERLEYITGYVVDTGLTCGNSIVEIGEACDDGGTSWTAGACAGDCSRINYWSDPKYATEKIGDLSSLVADNLVEYCRSRNFRVSGSYDTSTGSGVNWTSNWGTISSFTTSKVISEIWCAD